MPYMDLKVTLKNIAEGCKYSLHVASLCAGYEKEVGMVHNVLLALLPTR